jgi:hypothetical protein
VLARGEIALSGHSADLTRDRHLLESSYLGEEAIEEAIEDVPAHQLMMQEPAND